MLKQIPLLWYGGQNFCFVFGQIQVSDQIPVNSLLMGQEWEILFHYQVEKTWTLLLVVYSLPSTTTLNNGEALTPPMGWMAWLRFGCSHRCDIDPDNCINENLFKEMTDIMAEDGYLEAGYNYISIDDCWMTMDRDSTGRLQADPKRFPNGIKGLADYVHGRGLKLGIYLSIGSKTCAGYPGSKGFVEVDATTIAGWGVDKLKFDGCHATIEDYARDFPAMGVALNRSGRAILYSCQWAMYAKYFGGVVDYPLISKTCNVFRALTDIYYDYHSVESMILYWASDPYNFSSVVGPGAWNDPDQMTIGNNGLTEDQEKLQMAMWAMMASPLIVSTDLRRIKKSSKRILLNKNVIAINQDPLAIQAKQRLASGSIRVWEKRVMPPGSVSFCLVNLDRTGPPALVEFTMDSLASVNLDGSYDLFEVFDMKPLGRFSTQKPLVASVPAASALLIKAIPSTTL